MYQIAAILAEFLLIYSAVAGGIERSWVNGPIIITAVGLVLGPYGEGVLRKGAAARRRAHRRSAGALDLGGVAHGVTRKSAGKADRASFGEFGRKRTPLLACEMRT